MELHDNDKLEVEWYTGWFTARIPKLCDIDINVEWNDDENGFDFSVQHSSPYYHHPLVRRCINLWLVNGCDQFHFEGIDYVDVEDLSKAMLEHEVYEVRAA